MGLVTKATTLFTERPASSTKVIRSPANWSMGHQKVITGDVVLAAPVKVGICSSVISESTLF